MRRRRMLAGLSAGSMGLCRAVWGQVGKKRSPNPQVDDRAMEILRQWEAASRDRSDVVCDFQLSRTGPLQKAGKSVESGVLAAFRTDGMRIDLADESGQPAATYFWLGGQLRHFDYKSKTENVYVPTRSDRGPKLNPLANVAEKLSERMAGLPDRFRFGLFGMPATEAASRFRVRVGAENDLAVTLTFEPIADQDRQDVRWIEVVLDKRDFRPLRAEIQSVIGVRFAILPTTFRVNQRLESSADSLAANLPTGWKKNYPLRARGNPQAAN